MYVAEDRKQSSLDGFWKTLTAKQTGGVGAVDMWDPYIVSVREHVPEADTKIVFDKFHVAQHLGDAVAEGDGHAVIQLHLRTSGEKALSLVAQLGSEKSAATDDQGGAEAQTRFENIITYLRHRITKATSESINAKIQLVKYRVRGFRNKQNFVHAIYFHRGGLDVAPEATK